MRDILYKKEFAVVIILLFIGTSTITSISANIISDTSSVASIQLVINNDGSGDPVDKRVNVPAYIPDSGYTPTLAINFTIVGSYNGTTAFYGDDPWEDWKNITVLGDVLYPVEETTLFHVGTKGDWNCLITPTQANGVISIQIDWTGYGSAIESIQIVNGTFVTHLVESFPWGQDCNLTFSIQDMDFNAIKNAEVYLIWEQDDDEFNMTIGTDTVGNGFNGEYVFWITKEDQGVNAPKNITIAVNGDAGYWGYTKVIMKQYNPPIRGFFSFFGYMIADAVITETQSHPGSDYYLCKPVEKVTVIGLGFYYTEGDIEFNTRFYMQSFTNVSELLFLSSKELAVSDEYQHISMFITKQTPCMVLFNP